MYRFHSLAETPVRLNGQWYTVMVGVDLTREDTNLHEPEKSTFDFFIFNRNPKEGVYIEGASLGQVVVFLSFANHNPAEIIRLHEKHAGSGLTKPAVSLDDVVEHDGVDLTKTTLDFEIDPSFEPFILPTYVSSELEFRKKQIFERAQPYVKFCKAIGKEVDDNAELNRWIDRNASFARLAYIIKDRSLFKPLNYCRGHNHYWDWFEAKNGTLFLRTVYIASMDEDSHILTKERQPKEYEVIPEAVCPTHNTPLELENGFYVGYIPVSNEAGIHMRPTQAIVDNAQRYKGKIFISHNGHKSDAKKIMEVAQLEAVQGSRLRVEFEDVGDPNMRSVYHRLYRAATTELR